MAKSRLVYPEQYSHTEDYDDALPKIVTPPPANGKPFLQHIETFVSQLNTYSSRLYVNPDEAYRHARTQQTAMRRDPVIMQPLRQRQLATALLDWQVVPEDQDDPVQKFVCQELTKIVKATPSFLKFRMALLEAVWFGRYGVNVFYEWGDASCQTMRPCRWLPIHGDKLAFEFETGNVGVMIGRHLSQGGEVRFSYESKVRMLEPHERLAVVLHTHEIEDGEFFDPWTAGAIHGVGLRTRVYWPWWLKQTSLQWLMDHMQRVGTGFTLWFYEHGNKEDEKKTREAAENFTSENVILVPMPIGQEKPFERVKRIEPGGGGAELFKSIIDQYLGQQIKGMIVGQQLTSEAAPTGMGSGVATVHQDTFLQIVEFDAQNLDETVTTDYLKVLARYNFKGIDWTPKFELILQEQDPKAMLEAAQVFQQMGGRIGENQLREIIGLAEPDQSDRVLGQSAAMPQEDDILFGHGKPHLDSSQIGAADQPGIPLTRQGPRGGRYWLDAQGRKHYGLPRTGTPVGLPDGWHDAEAVMRMYGGGVDAYGRDGEPERYYEWDEEQHPRDEKGRFSVKSVYVVPEGGHVQVGKKRYEPGEQIDTHEISFLAKEHREPYKESLAGRKLERRFTGKSGAAFPPEVHDEIRGLKIRPDLRDIKLVRNEYGELKGAGLDSKGRAQPIYPSAHRKRKDAEKFERGKRFLEVLPKTKEKLRAAAFGEAGSRKEAALALFLISETGMRPGSDRDTGADVEATGATTLDASQVRIDGDKVVMQFTGKSAHDNYWELEDADFAEEMRQRVARGGRIFNTSDAALRKLIKDVAGDYKVKDFRTLKANLHALDRIGEMPTPKTAEEYRAAVAEVAKYVADRINNTPQVSYNSYINPEVFGAWQASLLHSGIPSQNLKPSFAKTLTAASKKSKPKKDPTGGDKASQTTRSKTLKKTTPKTEPTLFARTSEALQYGKWRTIGKGGHGAKVYIENGVITKGCPELQGEEVGDIDHPDLGGESAAETPAHIVRQRERQVKQKQKWESRSPRKQAFDAKAYQHAKRRQLARKEGVDPGDVEKAFKLIREEHHKDVKEHNAFIGEATKRLGVNLRNRAFRGGDQGNLKAKGVKEGFDELAVSLANDPRWAHHLGGRGDWSTETNTEDWTQPLFDKLAGGRREVKGDDDLWQDAIAIVKEHQVQFPEKHRGQQPAQADEWDEWSTPAAKTLYGDAVPFSREWVLEQYARRYSRSGDEINERIKDAVDDMDCEPSEAQKESGNYRKGHVNIQGLPITIETPKGGIRRGVDKDGNPWECELHSHYGYIKRTESEADGDHVDVLIGPDPASEIVFIVDQVKPDSGRFDEHKCLIGWTNERDARDGYLANYADGWQGLGAITCMTTAEFKEWLEKGDTGSRIAEQYARKEAEGQGHFSFGDQPRETEAHDGKRPGEFAPKQEGKPQKTVKDVVRERESIRRHVGAKDRRKDAVWLARSIQQHVDHLGKSTSHKQQQRTAKRMSLAFGQLAKRVDDTDDLHDLREHADDLHAIAGELLQAKRKKRRLTQQAQGLKGEARQQHLERVNKLRGRVDSLQAEFEDRHGALSMATSDLHSDMLSDRYFSGGVQHSEVSQFDVDPTGQHSELLAPGQWPQAAKAELANPSVPVADIEKEYVSRFLAGDLTDEEIAGYRKKIAAQREQYARRKDAEGQGYFGWDEEKHPRDEGGKFSSKEHIDRIGSAETPEQLRSHVKAFQQSLAELPGFKDDERARKAVGRHLGSIHDRADIYFQQAKELGQFSERGLPKGMEFDAGNLRLLVGKVERKHKREESPEPHLEKLRGQDVTIPDRLKAMRKTGSHGEYKAHAVLFSELLDQLPQTKGDPKAKRVINDQLQRMQQAASKDGEYIGGYSHRADMNRLEELFKAAFRRSSRRDVVRQANQVSDAAKIIGKSAMEKFGYRGSDNYRGEANDLRDLVKGKSVEHGDVDNRIESMAVAASDDYMNHVDENLDVTSHYYDAGSSRKSMRAAVQKAYREIKRLGLQSPEVDKAVLGALKIVDRIPEGFKDDDDWNELDIDSDLEHAFDGVRDAALKVAEQRKKEVEQFVSAELWKVAGEKIKPIEYARRKSAPGQLAFDWDESKVVRDEEGKFAEKQAVAKHLGHPESSDLKQRIKDHLAEHGQSKLDDLRHAMGHKRHDKKNPLANPVHQAVREMMDAGELEVRQARFGEPVVIHKAKPAEKSKESSGEPETSLVQSILAAEPRTRFGTPVMLRDVRQQSGMEKDAFDAAVVALAEQGRVTLLQNDTPGLSAEKKAEMVSLSGNWYHGIAFRQSELEKLPEQEDANPAAKEGMTAADIGKLLANQWGNRKTGRTAEDLQDRWVSSEQFTEMEIPIELATPAVPVEEGAKSHSSGPIVVDLNKTGAGRHLGMFGAAADILILDGKHRHAQALSSGAKTIKAMVGNKAVPLIEKELAKRAEKQKEVDQLKNEFFDPANASPGSQLKRFRHLLPHDEVEEIRRQRREIMAKHAETKPKEPPSPAGIQQARQNAGKASGKDYLQELVFSLEQFPGEQAAIEQEIEKHGGQRIGQAGQRAEMVGRHHEGEGVFPGDDVEVVQHGWLVRDDKGEYLLRKAKVKPADKLPGGKADDAPDTAFDAGQFAKGKAVEREHTSDPATAKEIAKDHLSESPTYYEDLEKVEGKSKPKVDPSDKPFIPEAGISGEHIGAHYMTYKGRLADKLAELVRKHKPGASIPEDILTPQRVGVRYKVGLSPEDAAQEIFNDLVKERLDRPKKLSMSEIVKLNRELVEKTKQEPAEPSPHLTTLFGPDFASGVSSATLAREKRKGPAATMADEEFSLSGEPDKVVKRPENLGRGQQGHLFLGTDWKPGQAGLFGPEEYNRPKTFELLFGVKP